MRRQPPHRRRLGMMFASGFSSPGLPSRTDRYPHQNNSRAFSTQGDGTSSPLSPPNARAILLNQQLDALRSSHHEQSEEASFASKLMVAALLSIQDPLLGYDQRFGKPALKTYRSFVFPKQKEENENIQVQAAASRCARQIDFLVKRHQSHETQWIRHHDSQDDYQRETQTFPIVLVLDNLRSALNVGSIYRTAETCACLQVLTCGITPHPHGSGAEKIRKSALGAEMMVSTHHFPTTKLALRYVKETYPGMTVLAMETTDRSKIYSRVNYGETRTAGVAIIMGNVVTGVDSELLQQDHVVDEIIELPTFGRKNSLNVAACAPVVIYEILRQWNAAR